LKNLVAGGIDPRNRVAPAVNTATLVDGKMKELADAAAKPPPPPFMPYRDKEKQRDRQRVWMKRRRDGAFMLLGGRCNICGSRDRLELDHVDPRTKASHKIWTWSVYRILQELSKCQLLCRHCHENKSCIELTGFSPKMHGKVRTYERHGCRCNLCKKAKYLKRIQYGEISGKQNKFTVKEKK